jgi:hypothetical protein
MPDLPTLPTVDRCPDPACDVALGVKHLPECGVAICVSTGHQRLLHDPSLALAVCVDIYPGQPVVGGAPLCHLDCGIPVWRHGGHICGEDVWTGFPHGSIEAVAAGLFVYRDDTGGWTPCGPGTPDAVPDLTRVAATGTWNPIRQLWELPAHA